MAGAFLRPREKRVSHICVWRYVRPFVRNNNHSVCNYNCVDGFARDDGLPQHLAAASQAVSGPYPSVSWFRCQISGGRTSPTTSSPPPAIACAQSSASLLATPSSPPPARTQIWPTMHLLTLERVGWITVISWWIVGRYITINDAWIARHQFPTARVRRWKRRADHGLCPGRRCAAQHCRSHRQSQNQPLHLSLPTGHHLWTH